MKPNRERRQRFGEKRFRGGDGKRPSYPATGTNVKVKVAGDRNPKNVAGE